MSNKEGVSLEEQNLTNLIEEMSSVLGNPASIEPNFIKEDQFVHVFLPIFAGETNLYAKSGADISLWQTISGGPFREVSVRDNRGEELFRVPPLFNLNAMKPLDGTGDAQGLRTLADVIATASLVAKQGKTRMNNYLAEEFERRDFMFATEKDESDYIQRWNAILARYNRPPINLNIPGAAAASPAVDNDIDEFTPL